MSKIEEDSDDRCFQWLECYSYKFVPEPEEVTLTCYPKKLEKALCCSLFLVKWQAAGFSK